MIWRNNVAPPPHISESTYFKVPWALYVPKYTTIYRIYYAYYITLVGILHTTYILWKSNTLLTLVRAYSKIMA